MITTYYNYIENSNQTTSEKYKFLNYIHLINK